MLAPPPRPLELEAVDCTTVLLVLLVLMAVCAGAMLVGPLILVTLLLPGCTNVGVTKVLPLPPDFREI